MIETKTQKASRKPINPCLDIVDDVIYVNVPRLSEDSTYINFMIGSNRDCFQLGSKTKELEKRSLVATSRPELIKLGLTERWSRQGVEDFLKGGSVSDPARVYETLLSIVKKHIHLQHEEEYGLLAIYVMSTYFRPLFEQYPLIYFHGQPESGKSQAMKLIAYASFNGRYLTDVSAPSLSRTMQSTMGTHCLDEMEKLGDYRCERPIISTLLGCFDNGQRQLCVSRVGEDYAVETFKGVAPVVIANTRGVQDEALRTRLITFKMVYSGEFKHSSLPKESDPVWVQIRDLLYPYMMGCWQQVAANYGKGTGIDELSAREENKYAPLKAVADTVEEGLFESFVPYIRAVKQEDTINKTIDSLELLILQFLENEVQEGRAASRSNKQLCEQFNQISGFLLNPARFSRLVRGIGVVTNKRSAGGSVVYDLVPAKIKEQITLFERKA